MPQTNFEHRIQEPFPGKLVHIAGVFISSATRTVNPWVFV